MATNEGFRRDWTPVLRLRPKEIVYGRPHGGYCNVYEIVCPGCGDLADVAHRDIPPRTQRILGPYLLAEGIAAYEAHYAEHRAREVRVNGDHPPPGHQDRRGRGQQPQDSSNQDPDPEPGTTSQADRMR
jgi:hypothetical protein